MNDRKDRRGQEEQGLGWLLTSLNLLRWARARAEELRSPEASQIQAIQRKWKLDE